MIRLLILLAASSSPGAVEAERAFAASAQTQGQWSAFRAFAAADAIMFTPRPVKAQEWLVGRSDPARAVMWWPASSYVSCDGTVAVNTGPWLRDGGTLVGYFTTIWRRQGDGSWKWLLDHGDGLARARPAGDAVRPRRASCKGRPAPASAGTEDGRGGSGDNSLIWSWKVSADGARQVSVSLWDGSAHARVIDDHVAAGQP